MITTKLKAAAVLMAAAIFCTGCGSIAPATNAADSTAGDPYDVYRAEDLELLIYSQKVLRVKCLEEMGYPEFKTVVADGPSDQTRRRLAVSAGQAMFHDATDAAARGFGFPSEADPGSVVVHDPTFEKTFLDCDTQGWEALGASDKTLHSDYVALANRLVTALMNGTGAAASTAMNKIAQCLVDQGKPVVLDPNSNWGLKFEIPMGTVSAPNARWEPKQVSGVEVRPSSPAVPYVPTAEESELAVAYYECSVSTNARQDFAAELLKAKQAAVAKEETLLAELNPKIEALAKKAANLSA